MDIEEHKIELTRIATRFGDPMIYFFDERKTLDDGYCILHKWIWTSIIGGQTGYTMGAAMIEKEDAVAITLRDDASMLISFDIFIEFITIRAKEQYEDYPDVDQSVLYDEVQADIIGQMVP